MNRKSIVIGSAAIASLFALAVAAPAVTQRAGWRTDTSATSADRGKIEAIQKKYEGDLTRMEAQLRITERELDQALADQDSAKAAELRQKLSDQQKEYFSLRDKAWSELREAGGYPGAWAGAGGYGPYGMMGGGYGPHGMMNGYGPYGMMNNGYGGCAW
jgi:hypothetical protein